MEIGTASAKTIAITRSRKDADEFVALMESREARPITLPTIQLVARGEEIATELLDHIREYDPDYCIFMSSKAVHLLFDSAERTSRLDQLRLAVANSTVIAVGPATRDALSDRGIKTNHMPTATFSSVGVGEVLSRLGAVGKKALIPRSSASTPFLKDLLNKIGLDVREVHIYDVRAADGGPDWDEFTRIFSDSGVDGMIFTSASSVRAFFEIMQRRTKKDAIIEGLKDIKVVSIGPFTADELVGFGVQGITARVHTVPGAVDAIFGDPAAALQPV